MPAVGPTSPAPAPASAPHAPAEPTLLHVAPAAKPVIGLIAPGAGRGGHAPCRRGSPRQAPLWVVAVALLVAVTSPVGAQGVDPDHRPIAEIRIAGLEQVSEQFVRNQIRSEVGAPYRRETVDRDIVRVTRLGRFEQVTAEVTQRDDGAVILTFVVEEQPLFADVRVVGNRAVTDQDLLERVQLRAGDPVDQFLIDRGVQRIIEAYEERGYFVAEVNVERELLDEDNILIYQVREGPRVRIRGIEFEGNETYSDRQLRNEISSETYFPVFRSGELQREQLDLDAAAIRDFYRDRGFLDAQVGRRIALSPDQREAVVTFAIEEGPRYLVDAVRIEGSTVFPEAQIRQAMPMKVGNVFSEQNRRRSERALEHLYGRLGYVETRVAIDRLFHSDEPRVDLLVQIEEGEPSRTGTVTVRGNEVTQDKVILRQVRGMEPGRPFDREGVEQTQRRLTESPLFSEAEVTLLGEPDDPVRDVLIEVDEQSTGELNFGAGVSSDLGVVGSITLTQRNFDITDFPESAREFFTGQSFRGAGQFFSLNLQPGREVSQYSVNFREPYLFESDFFFDTEMSFFSRLRRNYDERRFGGRVGIGQRFGDVWSASARVRATTIRATNIADRAPIDVHAVAGDHVLTGLGIDLERDTTDSAIFPTRGSRWTLGLERVGTLGGDFDFTRAEAGFQQFWTTREDFFGRRTVLSGRVQAGYIFEEREAPVFERFYAGGHRTFRGFNFRGVGPRGVRQDTGTLGSDPVGGDWRFLAGLEYNVPLYDEVLRGVVFSDAGTVQQRFGFDQWRVSVGAGLRIYLPMFGQVPFALDFAWPLRRERGDQTRVFSFDLAVPLQ